MPQRNEDEDEGTIYQLYVGINTERSALPVLASAAPPRRTMASDFMGAVSSILTEVCVRKTRQAAQPLDFQAVSSTNSWRRY